MVAEEAASEQPGSPQLQGRGGRRTCERSWCEWLSLVLSFSPWLSLCPYCHPSFSFPPALLPFVWRLEGVSGGEVGHPPFLGVPAAQRRGREGRGGAGEWLFVLECGVVQWAVKPFGMRDG